MVIYVSVKFEFDWTNRFRVRVQKQKTWTNRWMDRQTDKKWTNRQTNGRNFTILERNLPMMVIYVPVKYEFDWTKHFRVRVRKQKCSQTDRQTNRQKTDK